MSISAYVISSWITFSIVLPDTSSNSIVKSLIKKADDDVKAQIEELVAGKTIGKVIHEDITYADIDIQYLLNQNNIK